MPIIAICFYMILLRLARHKIVGKRFGSNSSRGNLPTLGSSHREANRMQNLEVHLSTDVTVEDGTSKASDRYMLQGERD